MRRGGRDRQREGGRNKGEMDGGRCRQREGWTEEWTERLMEQWMEG